jgi:hypothetical protein
MIAAVPHDVGSFWVAVAGQPWSRYDLIPGRYEGNVEMANQAVTPVGLNHLVLNVRDIEESHRFWTETKTPEPAEDAIL